MITEILKKLQKLQLRTVESTSKNNTTYMCQLPSDYIEFMAMYDGGVGFVGANNNYLDLWPIELVAKLNSYYEDEEYSNQVIIVGSNGSGTLYGFDLLRKSFFESDEYQMKREEVVNCANSFSSAPSLPSSNFPGESLHKLLKSATSKTCRTRRRIAWSPGITQ